MSIVDIISIIIVAGFLFWGMKKGFILEISEIAGLFFGFVLALYLPLDFPIGWWKYLVSFLIYFFIISVVFVILSKIVNKTPLALIDKILGGVTGAIKGFLLVGLLMIIIAAVPGVSNNRVLRDSVVFNSFLVFKPAIKNFLRRKMHDLKNKEYKIPEKPPGKEVI